MATYIKVAGELYPAVINGSMADYTWDGRESKSITLTMSHDKVAALLTDGTPWRIVPVSYTHLTLPTIPPV